MNSVSEAETSIKLESGKTPEGYVCGDCGVKHVRLWTDKKRTGLLCDGCMKKVHPVASMSLGANMVKTLTSVSLLFGVFPAIPDELGGFYNYLDCGLIERVWWFSLPANEKIDS